MPLSRLAALALLVFPAFAASLAAQSDARAKLVVPNVPDVTIKTRRTSDRGGLGVTEVLYLKGARQRREEHVEVAPQSDPHWAFRGHTLARISQCDERRRLMLNHDAKTYAYYPIEDPSREAQSHQAQSQPAPSGRAPSGRVPSPQVTPRPTVTVTIDAVDTGERRQVGPYIARHVVTTRTTESGPGDVNTERNDGWYIDVPQSDCMAWEGANAAHAQLLPSGAPLPDVKFNVRGTARRGYPVEETFRMDGRYAAVSRLELIEVSDAPLDPALFTVPSDYRPALPHPYGGYDLSKPDTILNRLQAFRQVAAEWTDYILRHGLQGILPGTQAPARY